MELGVMASLDHSVSFIKHQDTQVLDLRCQLVVLEALLSLVVRYQFDVATYLLDVVP